MSGSRTGSVILARYKNFDMTDYEVTGPEDDAGPQGKARKTKTGRLT